MNGNIWRILSVMNTNTLLNQDWCMQLNSLRKVAKHIFNLISYRTEKIHKLVHLKPNFKMR